VEQAVRAVGGNGFGPLETIAVAAPVTYLLALGSWRLVEAPAMRLRAAVVSRRGRLEAASAPARASA
jgi:peptidoglycan/LPS O-acetylase OafA/YrhL